MELHKPEDSNAEHINGSHHPIKDFVMDDKGYFLIRVNKKEERIEAGFCKEKNIILKKITGKTAEEVGYTIVRKKIVEHPQHLLYLGKELEKAEIALKLGIEYVQDDPLNLSDVKMNE